MEFKYKRTSYIYIYFQYSLCNVAYWYQMIWVKNIVVLFLVISQSLSSTVCPVAWPVISVSEETNETEQQQTTGDETTIDVCVWWVFVWDIHTTLRHFINCKREKALDEDETLLGMRVNCLRLHTCLALLIHYLCKNQVCFGLDDKR